MSVCVCVCVCVCVMEEILIPFCLTSNITVLEIPSQSCTMWLFQAVLTSEKQKTIKLTLTAYYIPYIILLHCGMSRWATVFSSHPSITQNTSLLSCCDDDWRCVLFPVLGVSVLPVCFQRRVADAGGDFPGGLELLPHTPAAHLTISASLNSLACPIVIDSTTWYMAELLDSLSVTLSLSSC